MASRKVVVVDASSVGQARKRARPDDFDDSRKDERQRFTSGYVGDIMAATSGNFQSKGPRRVREESEMDFRTALNSVRDLGSLNQQKVKNRKELQEKKLAALGARITWKPQTMPYKMYLGVTKKRKEREGKAAEQERVGQVVTGKKYATVEKKKERKRRSDWENSDAPEPDNIRGPVMFVGKR